MLFTITTRATTAGLLLKVINMMLLTCCVLPRFRYLCDRVVPGNRVTIMGIYSIKKVAAAKARGRDKTAGVGIRASYLRVVGILVDTEGAGTLHQNSRN